MIELFRALLAGNFACPKIVFSESKLNQRAYNEQVYRIFPTDNEDAESKFNSFISLFMHIFFMKSLVTFFKNIYRAIVKTDLSTLDVFFQIKCSNVEQTFARNFYNFSFYLNRSTC